MSSFKMYFLVGSCIVVDCNVYNYGDHFSKKSNVSIEFFPDADLKLFVETYHNIFTSVHLILHVPPNNILSKLDIASVKLCAWSHDMDPDFFLKPLQILDLTRLNDEAEFVLHMFFCQKINVSKLICNGYLHYIYDFVFHNVKEIVCERYIPITNNNRNIHLQIACNIVLGGHCDGKERGSKLISYVWEKLLAINLKKMSKKVEKSLEINLNKKSEQ